MLCFFYALSLVKSAETCNSCHSLLSNLGQKNGAPKRPTIHLLPKLSSYHRLTITCGQ